MAATISATSGPVNGGLCPCCPRPCTWGVDHLSTTMYAFIAGSTLVVPDGEGGFYTYVWPSQYVVLSPLSAQYQGVWMTPMGSGGTATMNGTVQKELRAILIQGTIGHWQLYFTLADPVTGYNSSQIGNAGQLTQCLPFGTYLDSGITVGSVVEALP